MTACDKIEEYLTRNRLKKREIDELLLRFGYSPFHVTLTRSVKNKYTLTAAIVIKKRQPGATKQRHSIN